MKKYLTKEKINIQEYGVIAGSNKRRTTINDVKPLIESMFRMSFLEDKPICYIWSNDPRLDSYKTKAFEDVEFSYSNGNTNKDVDFWLSMGYFDELRKHYKQTNQLGCVEMKIKYKSKEQPYKVVLDGKRRLLAAYEKSGDAYFCELDPNVLLEDYLSVVNPSLLNN